MSNDRTFFDDWEAVCDEASWIAAEDQCVSFVCKVAGGWSVYSDDEMATPAPWRTIAALSLPSGEIIEPAGPDSRYGSVTSLVRHAGGATKDEIAVILGLPTELVSRWVPLLLSRGWLDIGRKRVCRETGQDAVVLVFQPTAGPAVSVCEQIRRFLSRQPGWKSRAQIAQALGISPMIVSRRISELCGSGFAEQSGERMRCRLTGEMRRHVRKVVDDE